MKFASVCAGLSAGVLLAGCASAAIGVHSGSPAPSARAESSGRSYGSTAVHLQGRPNAYFGLLFLGYVAAGVADHYPGWSHGPAGRKPPRLLPDRAIAERDCSLPMNAPSANLRCK